jgi:hypothetical protein
MALTLAILELYSEQRSQENYRKEIHAKKGIKIPIQRRHILEASDISGFWATLFFALGVFKSAVIAGLLPYFLKFLARKITRSKLEK